LHHSSAGGDDHYLGVLPAARRIPPLFSRAMSVSPVPATGAVLAAGGPARDPDPVAVARAKLQQVAPVGRWDAVMAEVRRLQEATSATPLQAYETVLARLATGWTPSA
jgi:hypothetical protein